ncbi:MAG: aminotransferase class I/II-fold pyridoxal phosphate-dependent enzyme [Paracoccaceae bacterium]
MQYPDRFAALPAYPFPRLRALLDDHPAGGAVLSMSIGDPTHAFPDFVAPLMNEHMATFGGYPPNDGAPELLEAIAGWLGRRYGVTGFDGARILPLNGTREGLFNAALALSPEQKNGMQPAVLLPNPFYQCYMVAARAAGAEPVMVPARAETGFLPDYASLPAALLDRVSLAYICSPANPQGAVADAAYWTRLLALAEKHDFIVLADECYAEIYRQTPPPGALELAQATGANPERVMAFHSLSKRSNLAGLRSGFVAGGPENIAQLKQLRAYGGAPLPLPIQKVSAAVWADDAHARANRALYAAKFDLADRMFGNITGLRTPDAGFFLWLAVDDDEAAALKLWVEHGVRVLPGRYLANETHASLGGGNPGQGYIRVALVAPINDIERGLGAIRASLYEG